jgi:hypothetical protein
MSKRNSHRFDAAVKCCQMQARLAPAARERREKEQNPGKVSHQIGEACVARARVQLLVALADVAALSSIMIQETGPACRLWELE